MGPRGPWGRVRAHSPCEGGAGLGQAVPSADLGGAVTERSLDIRNGEASLGERGQVIRHSLSLLKPLPGIRKIVRPSGQSLELPEVKGA